MSLISLCHLTPSLHCRFMSKHISVPNLIEVKPMPSAQALTALPVMELNLSELMKLPIHADPWPFTDVNMVQFHHNAAVWLMERSPIWCAGTQFNKHFHQAARSTLNWTVISLSALMEMCMKGCAAVLLNLRKSCGFNRFIHISPVSVSIRLEMFFNIVP